MSLNPISKTGLIASPKKTINRRNRFSDHLNLSKCAVAKPVMFSLRPFSGLFNPYSKSCSILCNHPGPHEVKTVVKQAKDAWISEGKAHFHRDNADEYGGRVMNDINEHIPEEFFKRYTGSDSRPLTPTPTVASGRTRVSTGSHANARRCFTPDPVNSCAKERKQLILDLRRSHSQETLFWNASSELSAGGQARDATTKDVAAANGSKNMRLCEQEALRKSAERKAQLLREQENKPTTVVCINDKDEQEEEDDDAPRRRGKRRKKSKCPAITTFQVNQEPETQIATLGPDSPNPSTRPSLIPNDYAQIPRMSMQPTDNPIAGRDCLKSSFISEDALKFLRRGLNIDIVENSFDRYMNKALHEALRTIPPEQINAESEALRKFKETVRITEVDNEKWLDMPRKFTRNSARFGLPVNTMDLAKLTPYDYVSKHIWISDYRKQLYRYVFTKYLPETNEDNASSMKKQNSLADTDTKSVQDATRERTIAFGDLHLGLRTVLGFHGTDDKINDIKTILQLNERDHAQLNYRSWCGIVAFAERYLNTSTRKDDRCDEIETADFESLERKFSYVDVPKPLKFVLNLIKNN